MSGRRAMGSSAAKLVALPGSGPHSWAQEMKRRGMRAARRIIMDL